MKVDAGGIDLLFSDSDPPVREQEVKRFLPPDATAGDHSDARRQFSSTDRPRSCVENGGGGVLSVVLLPTPRGLVIAQKRAGRL